MLGKIILSVNLNKMIRVDTNYIVRYLVNDNIEMADIAEEILTTKNVFISNEILAEVAYVLLGVYEIAKVDISNQLLELVDFENISVSNSKVVAVPPSGVTVTLASPL